MVDAPWVEETTTFHLLLGGPKQFQFWHTWNERTSHRPKVVRQRNIMYVFNGIAMQAPPHQVICLFEKLPPNDQSRICSPFIRLPFSPPSCPIPHQPQQSVWPNRCGGTNILQRQNDCVNPFEIVEVCVCVGCWLMLPRRFIAPKKECLFPSTERISILLIRFIWFSFAPVRRWQKNFWVLTMALYFSCSHSLPFRFAHLMFSNIWTVIVQWRLQAKHCKGRGRRRLDEHGNYIYTARVRLFAFDAFYMRLLSDLSDWLKNQKRWLIITVNWSLTMFQLV